jgi:hypothetical protein
MVAPKTTRVPMPSYEYAYRQNEDGTVDAICLHCFLTAGTAKTPAEVSKKVVGHESLCVDRKRPRSVQFFAEPLRKTK